MNSLACVRFDNYLFSYITSDFSTIVTNIYQFFVVIDYCSLILLTIGLLSQLLINIWIFFHDFLEIKNFKMLIYLHSSQ